MKRTALISLSFVAALLVHPIFANDPAPTKTRVNDGFEIKENDWPWWRGPQRDGTALPSKAPLKLSAENVIWKTQVPGRGHGSPIVVGDRVLLATANEDTGSQSLLCYSRENGKSLWEHEAHASGAMKRNKKASGASGTPAWDGERAFICFPNSGALYVTAVDAKGDRAWQQEVSKYTVHQGYGASPALYQNLVIVSADNKSGGAIAAYHRKTGELVWKRERPTTPNYPSPTLLHVAGRDQLIMTGCDKVSSYEPLTGKTIWEIDGATTECVTSTVTDGNLVYTSGGYPKNHMSAIRADGSGEVAWENGSRLYVPSLVIRNGYLYGVLDAGIATCWNAATGKEMWKQRLGGTFSSSPVLVGSRILVGNEAGQHFAFEATPSGFKKLAESQVGSQVFATPTVAGNRVYHRVVEKNEAGGRQEWLYCFGAKN